MSYHFYIYNESDLVGTLTKVPLKDVYWCDTFLFCHNYMYIYAALL